MVFQSRSTWAWPYALFMLCLVILPLLLIGVYAFTDADGSFTIQNFVSFFTKSEAINTFVYSFISNFFISILFLITMQSYRMLTNSIFVKVDILSSYPLFFQKLCLESLKEKVQEEIYQMKTVHESVHNYICTQL